MMEQKSAVSKMEVEPAESTQEKLPDNETEQPAGAKPDGKAKKKHKKGKKNRPNLNDPMQVIKDVLDKSSFKEANLSQLVEKKFQSPEYHQELCNALSNIVYESTVESTGNGPCSYDCVSLLPWKFKGQVVPGPSAIMSLTCITETPEKRWKRFKRGGKGQKKKEEEKVKNQKPTIT